MVKLLHWLCLTTLVACAADETQRPIKPGSTDTGNTELTTGSGSSTGITGTGQTTTTTSGMPTYGVFDCATIPAQPLSALELNAPRGYNDIVFNSVGEMIGHDSSSDVFIQASAPDTAVILAPANTTVYKMGMLSGGDFVAVTSAQDLIRVTPTGSITTLVNGLAGYGLEVFHDDRVYVATNYTSGTDGIVRVDPATGDWELLVDLGVTPRAIAFSPDWTALYVGTTSNGEVYKIELDANGDPVGDPTLLALVPNSWHDTVEVDACGNIYVGSVFSTTIYRIHADLSVTTLIEWTGGFGGPYGHGLEWGNAAGGWNDHSIYVTQPYIGSRITEYDIGVPGREWPGTVIGGVTL